MLLRDHPRRRASSGLLEKFKRARTVRSRVTAAILGAIAVAIFAAQPTNNMAVAYADVDTFLTDMEAAGFDNGDGNGAEIRVGRSICAEVAGGMSPSQAADD